MHDDSTTRRANTQTCHRQAACTGCVVLLELVQQKRRRGFFSVNLNKRMSLPSALFQAKTTAAAAAAARAAAAAAAARAADDPRVFQTKTSTSSPTI